MVDFKLKAIAFVKGAHTVEVTFALPCLPLLSGKV